MAIRSRANVSFDVNQDIWACRETFLFYKNDAEKSLKKENYTEKEASQHTGGSWVVWRSHWLQGPIGFSSVLCLWLHSLRMLGKLLKPFEHYI